MSVEWHVITSHWLIIVITIQTGFLCSRQSSLVACLFDGSARRGIGPSLSFNPCYILWAPCSEWVSSADWANFVAAPHGAGLKFCFLLKFCPPTHRIHVPSFIDVGPAIYEDVDTTWTDLQESLENVAHDKYILRFLYKSQLTVGDL